MGHPSGQGSSSEILRQAQRWRCGASDSAIRGLNVETWATLIEGDEDGNDKKKQFLRYLRMTNPSTSNFDF
jgi:hypothetical protein